MASRRRQEDERRGEDAIEPELAQDGDHRVFSGFRAESVRRFHGLQGRAGLFAGELMPFGVAFVAAPMSPDVEGGVDGAHEPNAADVPCFGACVEAPEVREVAACAEVERLLVVGIEVPHTRAGAFEGELAALGLDEGARKDEREHRVARAVQVIVLAAVLEVDAILGDVKPSSEADALIDVGARLRAPSRAAALGFEAASGVTADRDQGARLRARRGEAISARITRRTPGRVELDVVVAREKEDAAVSEEEACGGTEPSLVIGHDPRGVGGAALVVEGEFVERAPPVHHPRRVEIEDVAVEAELDGVAREARHELVHEAGEIGVGMMFAPAVAHPQRVRGILGMRLAEVHVGEDDGVPTRARAIRPFADRTPPPCEVHEAMSDLTSATSDPEGVGSAISTTARSAPR